MQSTANPIWYTWWMCISSSAVLVPCALFLTVFCAVDNASACSYIPRSNSAVVAEAPPGGLWWGGNIYRAPHEVGDVITLDSLDNGDDMEVEVAFYGPYSSIALRVPLDAVPGRSFRLPEEEIWEQGRQDPVEVVTVSAEGAVPDFPEIDVVLKHQRFSYDDQCGFASPREQWTVLQLSVAINVPEGFAVDIVDDEPDEYDFGAFPWPGWVDNQAGEILSTPPRPTQRQRTGDVVLRRLADGEVRHLTSFARTSPVSDNGCACTTTPAGPFGATVAVVLLLGLALPRRVHS